MPTKITVYTQRHSNMVSVWTDGVQARIRSDGSIVIQAMKRADKIDGGNHFYPSSKPCRNPYDVLVALKEASEWHGLKLTSADLRGWFGLIFPGDAPDILWNLANHPAGPGKKSKISVRAMWGNGDAESSIQISPFKWGFICRGGSYGHRGVGFYEGERFPVNWVFDGKELNIYQDSMRGGDCFSGPIGELMVEVVKY